jgi:hypothetical protein
MVTTRGMSSAASDGLRSLISRKRSLYMPS